MNGLYKGKYIIAIYDKDDRFIDVACLPSELITYANKSAAKSLISRICNGWVTSNKIYLIDVTEKQEDIFEEEDELFLDFVKKSKKEKEIKSKREYYRQKACQNETILW